MDRFTGAQDVMRCHVCKTAGVQMHCNTCLANLCKACVGEHFSADFSKPHKIVDFKDRRSTPLYPECKSHLNNRCDFCCKDCHQPLCNHCIANNLHSGHQISMLQDIIGPKKVEIKQDHLELKTIIYPKYQEIATKIKERTSHIESEYKELSECVTKHGEDWHRAIDSVVQEMKTEISKMKITHLEVMMKHLDEINIIMVDVEKQIQLTDEIQDTNDLSRLLSYKSRNEEIETMPAKIDASVPVFTSLQIDDKSIVKLFGSLSKLSIITEKHGYNTEKSPADGPFPQDRLKSPNTGSSPEIKQKSRKSGSFPLVRQLLDEPEVITTIDTGYGVYLFSVACLNDEEIWTRGNTNTMKLFSINQGSLLKSIRTKSGNEPEDITVTTRGDLVYTDNKDKSVNIVKKEMVEKVIKLQNWKPCSVCSTSSGDLLVIMENDDKKPSKVVRYTSCTSSREKQTIQFDDKGVPFFSSGSFHRRITENRNLDICVSDNGAKAVVVVNQAGKLRFRYTGYTPAPKNKPFNPQGITTDSQNHILTADDNNDCVHIIDLDGDFLRYIDCGLSEPWGLCTDTNDNLFVAQYESRQVKKIKYL